MAQRTGSSGSGDSGSGDSGSGSSGGDSSAARRQRAKSVQVQKGFPVGFALGSLALAAALIGLLVFAFANRGSGSTDPLVEAEKISGLRVSETAQINERDHVGGPVNYEQLPPSAGKHNAIWQTCGIYPAQIPSEHALHSLEHGAVWITYRPDLPAEQVEELRGQADKSYMLMSPLPGQSSPVMLSAWGRQLAVATADDSRVKTFIANFRQGPQTPERGASCTGGSTATGTTPLGAAPASVPAPAAS